MRSITVFVEVGGYSCDLFTTARPGYADEVYLNLTVENIATLAKPCCVMSVVVNLMWLCLGWVYDLKLLLSCVLCGGRGDSLQ